MNIENLKKLIEQAQGKSANEFWLATGKRPTDVIVDLAKALEEAERKLIKPLSIGELIHRLEGQTGDKWVAVPDIRQQHAEWSNATFGNVGPIGPLKHLAKEAREAAAAPHDLFEWADIQFLMWDAQRRAGISDQQIIEAMEDKLPILRARKWPAPKDGEAREHIRDEGDAE
ncbi:dATP/dGTP pyrophosphohydrolase domain-containing protein [Serratia fonticola]|uniref:dATP/dGTP pyrophosphohydrolase domain-containing protein n=1 Tax=Serratia fonticola TaxID=47917 RepID=UPI003F5F5EF7